MKMKMTKNKKLNYSIYLAAALILLAFPHFNLPPLEFQNQFVKLFIHCAFDIGLLTMVILGYTYIEDEGNVMVYTLFVGLPVTGFAIFGLVFAVFLGTTGYRDTEYFTSHKQEDKIVHQSIYRGGHRYIKARQILPGIRWFEKVELTEEEKNSLIRIKNKPYL